MRIDYGRRGQALIVLLFAVIVAGSILMTGGIEKPTVLNNTAGTQAGIPKPPSSSNKTYNLQLQTFGFESVVTPTPMDSPPLPTEDPTCKNEILGNIKSITDVSCGDGINNNIIPDATAGKCCITDGAAADPSNCCPNSDRFRECGRTYPYWCDAKPVIYLYPQQEMKVSVNVVIPGRISVSIPEYKNGWNVIAKPDGSIISDGKTYHELFYETVQKKAPTPITGVVVLKKDLRHQLTGITTQLGLDANEQREFLGYWLPRLNSIEKSYILVSYFTPEQKQLIDRVNISPAPDTLIQFIMYFRGIDKPIEIEPLTFTKVPKRSGFTAVEWGGVVDR
ncbi:MAG TPA: hypothetical protein VG965_02665 [Patescibacteria group bacterium]|nr:hypothetical protein [Patescibacteria group bacterium]